MRYLLDANAVIALLSDTTSAIARRTRRHAPRDIGLPAIVLHELYYGAFKSQRVDQNVARVDALQFVVLEFDQDDARHAGEVRAHLASKGTPIRPSQRTDRRASQGAQADAGHAQYDRVPSACRV